MLVRSITRLAISSVALAAALAAQTITVPQQAAGVEGAGSTSYPWNPCLNASCSIRSQYFYTANAFLNQGVNTPIVISAIRWRGNGGLVHAGGVVFPNVTLQVSTATPGAILAPNATFANNHGGNVATVFSGSVTTLATAGTTPNGNIVDIPLTTPFLYDPNGGDLCVDISNQGGPAGGPAVDQATGLGADGARLWDFTPNATAQSPASGNNQPGLAIVMELVYAPPSGTPATSSSFGTGCVRAFSSYYETFSTAAAFDLGNSSLTMLNGGNSYTVLSGLTSFQAPVAPTTLTLGDDSEALVTLSAPLNFPGGSTTQLAVCSNGFISSASGNGTSFTPDANALLNFANACWAMSWHDYNPSIGGTVTFEEISGTAYVTWNGVADFGVTGSSSTFQYQFNLATGDVHFVWGAMSGTGGGHVTGFSPAGSSVNPGSLDISAALPGTFSTAAADILPLTLASGGRPITGSTVNLTTANIPAGSPFGAVLVDLIGFPTGLPLAGMAGCSAYTGGLVTLTFIGPGTSQVTPFPVTSNNAFVGVNLFLQSAVYAPAAGLTQIGAIASNGVAWVLGDV